jgi:putative zinc finger/helix-turn-helix YgiT family protein
MNINHCPACGSDRLGAASRPESVAFKGLHVHVQNVLATECENCGYAFVTPKQHDANVGAARAAHVEQRATAKAAKGLLTGAELRAMREALGLSQKEAAELFGGGPVAFSKYENEDVAQSVAMDRLVRVIHSLGQSGLPVLRAAQERQVTVTAAANLGVSSYANEATSASGSAKLVLVFEAKRPKAGKRASELPQRSTQVAKALLFTPQRLH